MIFFISFFRFSSQKKQETDTIKISFQDTTFTTWVSETYQEKQEGLSIFNSLGKQEAMLFIFDKTGKHSFWMKNMKFPIDIVWLDEDKKIVFLKENARPEDFPQSYGGEIDSHYVLEFAKDSITQYNMREGDYFYWKETY